MNKKVYIFLADGFEDIEGLTVVDLMRRADIDIKTVSIKESKEITTSHGISMLTDLVFVETDFSDADMLVLPGGMPGTKYLNEYQPLRDLLADFYKKGGKVAAICAAPTVLASLGFLEKRKASATSRRWLLPGLRRGLPLWKKPSSPAPDIIKTIFLFSRLSESPTAIP